MLMTIGCILQNIEMAESNPYGSGELLLDQILLEEENTTYQHSFLIEDAERQILRTITERTTAERTNLDRNNADRTNDPKLNDARLNEHLQGLAEDLITLSGNLAGELEGASAAETLRVRTHQLAIAKLLVLTYGKSDFRLAAAHFHQGRAYLACRAYEQAVNHLTIASTKISKISEIKETKLYNSFILTTLGSCYYLLQRYDYSLEFLSRAYDIQNSGQILKNNFVAKLTLELLARTYLRLRPPEDPRARREKEETRLKYQEEAVRLTDRLIDVLAAQFTDFENAHSRVLALADIQRRANDSEESIRKQEGERRRKAEQGELTKLLQLVEDKLEFLVIDCDRNPARTALKRVRTDDSRRGEALEELGEQLHRLLELLAEKLKRQRIFKFKLLLSCALVTNSTDQELKVFMKQYEGEEGGRPTVKRLTEGETIEIYKLLLSYATRFSDNENQLLYLRRLEDIFAGSDDTPQNQVELLAIRRTLAKIYAQMHMEAEGAQVLEQIKTLQSKLFGPASKPVRRTQSMLKLMKRESQHPNSRVEAAKRLRKTVIVSNHAPRVLEVS